MKSLAIYVVILSAMLFLVDRGVSSLKGEINGFARIQCESAQASPVVGKYNDAIQTLVSSYLVAERINQQMKMSSRATLAAVDAQRLKQDIISIPKIDCSKPILP